ncbi:proteasome activator complex subunit 4 [Lingula anatina]|uniref:Proteasome activator complex subunit 4 n=1 Tax=Lingula anatina TaxID=7574 RepID=A0A1S3J2B2_LINAN|nr:proteasome activator complex subunit 4 [Lingula anatina]|eukprot:XP_013404552.1 proteasome activator complex subunit 4 [Lingula anatina]
MDEWEERLGFKPQREDVYNKLLPYAEGLDQESVEQLAEIKTHLSRSIQLCDVKVGVVHWVSQLTKYIRCHGLKFSKEDHICFVKILFEMITIPDLELSLVQKFSTLFISLLKKKELLSREDLELPWKPLYKLAEEVFYSTYEPHGLALFPPTIESHIKSVVRMARPYFSVESTQEMLEEWRPLMCPFDTTMGKAMKYFELFLPTMLPPEHHDKGFRLWFEEFMNLYDSAHNSPSWEANLVVLFARLAIHNTGYVDWNPYLPKIMTRFLRSFDLNVGTAAVQASRPHNHYDLSVVTIWISYLMGGDSTVQDHLEKLFRAIETFYHPSNHGKWTLKLMSFLSKLPLAVVKRVHRERHKKPSWEPLALESHRLTDEQITRFVKSMKDIVFLAMFSKYGSSDSAAAMHNLALLRPELIIPSLLEQLYPSLETLTEPHRLTACMNCLNAVARSMLSNTKWYPDGRNHLLPILNLSLPGIDPNDFKKSLVTFQLLSTFTAMVPFVDCSGASQQRQDLDENEMELCSATAQFEDVVLQFLDRAFAVIEMNTTEVSSSRTGSLSEVRLNPQELMIKVGMFSTVNAVFQQCSGPIFDSVLHKLFNYVSSSLCEIRLAGRFVADLIRSAARASPVKTLKKFVPFFCRNIKELTESDDVQKEEHLDDSLLFNLQLLSEVVRCDGKAFLPFKEDLLHILKKSLHLTSKPGYELARNLLTHLLKALTLIYTVDYRSVTKDWDAPLAEYLPIRDWAKPGDLDNMGVEWHVPSEEEMEFAKQLLEDCLLPELHKLEQFCNGQKMDRQEVICSLGIVQETISGAGSVFSPLLGKPIQLAESEVPLRRFKHICGFENQVVKLNGEEVRPLILRTVKRVLAHILSSHEDDTKSLFHIIQIYNLLLFYNGEWKEEFEARWRSFHIVKKAMGNKLQGKKQHLRAVLVDRLQLQHEWRMLNRVDKTFTDLHKEIFDDLLTLSVSRYREVRQKAQAAITKGFNLFTYSYKLFLSDILKYLKDPTMEHHQFKGGLYLVLGTVDKRCLATKRSWEILNQIWPVLVQAQHSEKPSILKLIDDIADKVHKHLTTISVNIQVPPHCLEVAQLPWSTQSPKPVLPPANSEEMKHGLEQQEERNSCYTQQYYKLVNTLVELVEGGTLRWKFYQIAMELLALIIRHDAKLPQSAVNLFVKNMASETLLIRKLSLGAVSSILKQQKRKHPRMVIDPFAVSGCEQPSNGHSLPGDSRLDNAWLQYRSDTRPDTLDKWEKTVFVDKTHWGYYCWPKNMEVYAPCSQQPKLGRKREELEPEEQPIYDHFTRQDFVDKMLGFLSLEENKGKDKFSTKHYTLFKGLFRNFDDAFLPYLKPHIEKLVADTSHDGHDSSQRCAAEIISGLIRGSKHWTFDKVSSMWEWLVPVLRFAINNMTTESVTDWGTCFATASESRDPRKLHWLFEVLMESPISGAGGSFGDASRLYVLQGALAQQEWRVAELLHRLINYLIPHLKHPYKNVRDRIGSVLTSISVSDYTVPHGLPTRCPQRKEFIEGFLPQLEVLEDVEDSPPLSIATTEKMEVDKATDDVTPDEKMEVDDESAANNHVKEDADIDDPRKSAIKLCKTVMKYVQGNLSRMFHCQSPEQLKLLPVIAPLNSVTGDDDLKRETSVTLACMAQTYIPPKDISLALAIAKEVSGLKSWHARSAILQYIQVMVFSNLFNLQQPEYKEHVKELVLHLLCDDQLEVREMAAVTLGGFLHCKYFDIDHDLLQHFEKLSSTKLKKKRRLSGPLSLENLLKRHAGVLGLSACIQAYPYDVPGFMPQVLMDLSDHVDDPQPIQMTVKKTLSDFRRTHHDNWMDHKQKFTDDQLVVLTDLLVSPNYYA